MNTLRERPEFYNTLTINCTTAILINTRVNPNSLPLSWKVLVSGYAPAYVYESGRLDRHPSLQALPPRTAPRHPRAPARRPGAVFLIRIRAGLPGAAVR